jgi:hypothetical protein
VIRSSFLAFILAAASPALAQVWHGPGFSTPQPEQRQQPHRAVRDTPHVWLAQMIHMKFINPEYAAALNTRGKMPDSSRMAEEQWVRTARDEIARARKAPPDARVLTVPRAKMAPSLDGRIYVEEWAGALQVPMQPPGASVWLLAHQGQLYLAAHAPADKTEDGFDQFRFWFHINLSPYLTSERVFLAGKGWLAQLREAPRPPDMEPLLESPDRTKLRQRTDWNIFERSRGASKVIGYRQYELAVDMAEAGLFAGVPFAAFFEIEGDPVNDAQGKFKSRTILGTAGSQAQPLWLRL